MLSLSQVNEFASVLGQWQDGVLDEWLTAIRRTTERLTPETLAALLDYLRESLPVVARDEVLPAHVRAHACERLAHAMDVVDGVRETDELRLILMRRWLKAVPPRRPDELLLLMRALDRLVHDIVDTYAHVQRRELERQAAELMAILDSIADGLIVYDSVGQIVRINATAQAMLGLSDQEQKLPLAERMRLRSFAESDGKPLGAEQSPVYRALHDEVVKSEILRVTDAEGTQRWIAASAAPVRLPSGEIGGAVATFMDVTHLQQMRDRMEDFVRMLSHDLRTPLATANLQAHLLTRTAELHEAVHKRAQTIIRATSRMEHMIRDLVDATRLETGHHKVELRPVEVRPFLVELTQRLAGVMEVGRVRTDVAESLPAVQADPDRLERILVNLLSNALKYSPAGSEVTIRARAVTDAVAISVCDQGPGIVADEVPHLFDRYFRAQRADRSHTDGLGLGLYITRLLVQAHGGHITVESTPGQGSKFTVTLRSV